MPRDDYAKAKRRDIARRATAEQEYRAREKQRQKARKAQRKSHFPANCERLVRKYQKQRSSDSNIAFFEANRDKFPKHEMELQSDGSYRSKVYNFTAERWEGLK